MATYTCFIKKMTSILAGGGGYDIFEKLHTLCQECDRKKVLMLVGGSMEYGYNHSRMCNTF
jgi:hypothetical protein